MINKMNFDIFPFKNQINKLEELKHKINHKSNNIKKNKELYKAALEFEAIFIKQILNSMKNTLNKNNDILNGGQIEEIFEDMLYKERSMQIARSKNFGIADLIYSQFSEIEKLKKQKN